MNSAEDIDFTVDAQNLYREENITDVKVASIRRLIPIQSDGSDDPNREELFMGHTQLMTPSGPLPIQCSLHAKTLDEALAEFPDAMRETVNQ
ncbi:MAG: cytoplasmic protein, partial [Desulfococcaceae bacterium]